MDASLPVPHFALPTASQLIRAVPDSEIVFTRDDVLCRHRREEIIEEQKEAVKQLRKMYFTEWEKKKSKPF